MDGEEADLEEDEEDEDDEDWEFGLELLRFNPRLADCGEGGGEGGVHCPWLKCSTLSCESVPISSLESLKFLLRLAASSSAEAAAEIAASSSIWSFNVFFASCSRT